MGRERTNQVNEVPLSSVTEERGPLGDLDPNEQTQKVRGPPPTPVTSSYESSSVSRTSEGTPTLIPLRKTPNNQTKHQRERRVTQLIKVCTITTRSSRNSHLYPSIPGGVDRMTPLKRSILRSGRLRVTGNGVLVISHHSDDDTKLHRHPQ